MKSLELNNRAYIKLCNEYKEYLETLGYSKQSVYYLPIHVQEFLYYQETNGRKNIAKLSGAMVTEYITYLQQRKNERQGGGLSTGTISKHIQAIKLFLAFLHTKYHIAVAIPELPIDESGSLPEVLTQDEINLIYGAIDEMVEYSYSATPKWLREILRSRDRAVLGIYYGCGLRRSEGVQLDTADLLFSRKLLQVRKGKNYKQRFVPIAAGILNDLEQYYYEGRPQLQRKEHTDAFFLTQRGYRANGQALLVRLQKIISYTDNLQLIQKKTGLHTLRHSIATHLLQNGMAIESISTFLGHDSLESTMLYTHLT